MNKEHYTLDAASFETGTLEKEHSLEMKTLNKSLFVGLNTVNGNLE